ncbi:MAG: glycosyltransferase [Bacteroidetes bacterium]|nr:glycosyltransferase [Bacteroidota bacterium]
MRILNICAYTWAIGGPARIIYDHTTEALKLGHEVTILNPMTPGEKVYDVPLGAQLVSCRRTVPISNLYREFSMEMYAYLKAHLHEFDIVHIHGIWHFGSLAPFLFKHRVPIVITIHGLLDQWAIGHHKWKKDLVTALYQKRILKKADLIHINNADEQGDVSRYLGYQPKNLVTIPNGIRMEEFAILPAKGIFREHFGIPRDKKLILFMGRLNIKKGLDLLLPAFADYVNSRQDAVLVLAGPDDGYQATVEAFIEDNQLQESIKLVGMLTGDVKKAALSDADIFALPSYSEGFSIAVLEAMAAGVPALVSGRVGFDNAIEEHSAAVVVPLTHEGVRDGLFLVLGNSEHRNQLVNNALKMLQNKFDIRAVARKMLDAYQTVKSA